MVRNGRIHGGLIPAWAGKTLINVTQRSISKAHPRVGGENWAWLPMRMTIVGSSPRGRGKLTWFSLCSLPSRLIPAWAGKTLPMCLSLHCITGSSPRGRGKQDPRAVVADIAGLIPAWAGKTTIVKLRATGVRAHPRVGGENLFAGNKKMGVLGSSPRGRGKQVLLR